MKTYWRLLIIGFLFLITACGNEEKIFDASGTFEADETIISARASGTLLAFEVEEGQALTKGMYLGFIDTVQLQLSKEQLQAQISAILSKKPDISAQMAALEEQLKAASIEKQRVNKLLEAEAATPQQKDEIDAQLNIIKGNITALKASLANTIQSIDKEIGPLQAQIKSVEDRIEKSKIINPIAGTVLTVYAMPHEQVGMRQPLYKIANLDELILRAYITGDQLPKVKLNQQVAVHTDDGDGGFAKTEGTLYWVSDKAEFTPKSIQTKNERAKKVYAVKIRVKNDGTFKIGMYGEIVFTKP